MRPTTPRHPNVRWPRTWSRSWTTLGFDRFAVVGHDRGAYAALRTAMDHPERVSHLSCSMRCQSAKRFVARPRSSPRLGRTGSSSAFRRSRERAILCDPDAWYGNSADKLGEENYADYRRAIHDPATVHAMVEDYRAGLTVDRAHDEADMARFKTSEVTDAGALGVARRHGVPLRRPARGLAGVGDGPAVTASNSGHHMAEEIPERARGARSARSSLAEVVRGDDRTRGRRDEPIASTYVSHSRVPHSHINGRVTALRIADGPRPPIEAGGPGRRCQVRLA